MYNKYNRLIKRSSNKVDINGFKITIGRFLELKIKSDNNNNNSNNNNKNKY